MTSKIVILISAALLWQPIKLNKDLIPIAILESSMGRFTNHKPHSKGIWWTSYGALGLKPIVAYEAYEKVKSRYPTIKNKDEFLSRFLSDDVFYNEMCNIHWNKIKTYFSDTEHAVYAWRWGIMASRRATDEMIDNSTYVAKYKKLRNAND